MAIQRAEGAGSLAIRFASATAALRSAGLRLPICRSAQLTVRFQSKLVSVTRDKAGEVIDGSADKVTDVTDVWTFARNVDARDPNWLLITTAGDMPG